MHLVVDGYGADPEKLRDKDLVRRFLDECPATLGMTKMIPPQVHIYRGRVPEDWGVSGFVLIAESHISVHTFPDRGYVNIDIFSCREFDPTSSLRDFSAAPSWRGGGNEQRSCWRPANTEVMSKSRSCHGRGPSRHRIKVVIIGRQRGARSEVSSTPKGHRQPHSRIRNSGTQTARV